MIYFVLAVALIALVIWVGGRLNDPDTPPEAPPTLPHGTSAYYAQYAMAWKVLKEDLGREPTIDELIDYVYGLREIGELTDGQN